MKIKRTINGIEYEFELTEQDRNTFGMQIM